VFVFQHWDQMPSAMSHKHTQAANLQPLALLSTIVAHVIPLQKHLLLKNSSNWACLFYHPPYATCSSAVTILSIEISGEMGVNM